MRVNIIKEDTGNLSPFSGYSDEKVESSSRIEVVGSGMIRSAIKEFEEYVNAPDLYNCKVNSNLILTPFEINSFLQLTSGFEYDIQSHRLGRFVTYLIDNSYKEGNNKFHLNLNQTKRIEDLCSFICASDDRRLEVNLIGNVGMSFGYNSKNITASISGNVGYGFGNISTNLIASIEGNVSDSFGKESKYMNATILGNVGGSALKRAENGSILIIGDVGSGFGRFSKKLKVQVKGDVAERFGQKSHDLNCLIKGVAYSDFGADSENLKALIQGDVKFWFGRSAKHLRAIIDGDARYDFGIDSENSIYLITGFAKNIGRNRNSKFITGQDASDHPIYKKVMEKYGGLM